MREVICADALDWLATNPVRGAIVTSLPDSDEIGLPLADWREWFARAVRAVLVVTPIEQPAIFYQTDRKAGGQIQSKAGLVLAAALAAGVPVLWHKIVLRRQVGATDLHRPTFAHLIAVSKAARPGPATPDVLPVSASLYPNGMPFAATFAAVRFAARTADTVYDPFCGRGTVLAAANAIGLRAIGIDIDPRQVAHAKRAAMSKTLEEVA